MGLTIVRLLISATGIILTLECVLVISREDFAAFPDASSSLWALAGSLLWLVSSLLASQSSEAISSMRRVLRCVSVIFFACATLYFSGEGGSITLLILSTTVVVTLLSKGQSSVVLTCMGALAVFGLLRLSMQIVPSVGIVTTAVGGAVGSLWVSRQLKERKRDRELYFQARRAAAGLVSVNARLQDAVDRTASITRLRERARIARDIHDDVGHTLTALIVQLQAAAEVFLVEPQNLVARLNRLEEMVWSTIQDVRRTVSTLRDESAVNIGTIRWQRLCEAFADAAGVDVITRMDESLEIVSSEISETVYRIIQEALTNAYRHGNAEVIDVSMYYDPEEEEILLRISDNGQGAQQFEVGNGLRGIRERVAATKGEIVWQTFPGRGFDLGAVIPWKGEERHEPD